ncbi:transcription factor [Ganoderma sinense ZZ0214-1]|uniref:Transcription factor n=1 Tax=Ganoderma sinense ZZ0214-1 TaxID=1077348 RepID=A0A2G8SC12_9APHY|nr:transcription factor [Ganoderma sinense ZZ0214-1]
MAPLRSNDKEPQAGNGGDSESRQRRKPGRVPVSCAECRRLKLRCDRQVPCESCTKRGCAALCPDGSLPTTKGPKVKAAAEVEELKEKVASLEAALRALSQGTHPLLRADTNDQSPADSSSPSGSSGRASGSDGNETSPRDQETLNEDEEEVLDAFGTLTLGNRGEARFFGQTSRTEYLIHAPERLHPFVNKVALPRLSSVTVNEAMKELDAFCDNEAVGEEVLSCMPSMEEALRMCDIFFENSKFLWHPLPREYVYTEIVSFLYQPPIGEYCHVTKKHALALLFMIFALATLFDMKMPPYSAEAMEYYILARIALRWAPPTYDTTLAAIQAMLYMAQYLEMSDCEPAHTGSHKCWVQTRHVCTLGFSIGLHVSGCKWRLDEVATAKRGRVFWQIFTQDTWNSFGFGRPPNINLAFVDCDIPKPEQIMASNGTSWSTEYHVWTWQFAKLMHTVMTAAFSAKSTTYSRIIELDKRIRDFPDPPCIQPPTGPPPPNASASDNITRTMQALFVTLMKDTTHLNLHRSYLSQALKDCSEDPLRHKYGASVMIIYRSVWRILNAFQSARRIAPDITARITLPWSHSLSCAILLCLIITRVPTSGLANPALIELDKICELFEEATNTSQIASNNIHVLRKLRKQAHAAISRVIAEDAAVVCAELDRLGGRTQLLHTVNELGFGCYPIVRRDDRTFVSRQKERSVFETQANPNGYVQGFVAEDQHMDDPPAPPVANPPAYDASEIDFDFMNDVAQHNPQGCVLQMVPVDFGQGPNMQNVDWIQSFLEMTGGAQQPQLQSQSQSQTTQPQVQVQVAADPQGATVPTPAEMDATWQALVAQLGI